jgi:hypothetical protein
MYQALPRLPPASDLGRYPARPMMNNRHFDDGSTICSYSDIFLVECPACRRCATSRRHGKNGIATIARFVCEHCGKTQQKELTGWHVGMSQDWFFEYPLWLRIPCCGHELWAHNSDHLRYIESYVSAKHRMRNPNPDATNRNTAMASRFPKWIINAKNRDEILKAIDKLHHKIAG